MSFKKFLLSILVSVATATGAFSAEGDITINKNFGDQVNPGADMVALAGSASALTGGREQETYEKPDGSPAPTTAPVTLDMEGLWIYDILIEFVDTNNNIVGTSHFIVYYNVGPAATATTFSFGNLTHTYDGNAKTATVTPNPGGATYTSDLTKGPGAGTYTVSATANGSFTGSGTATLTINKASPSLNLTGDTTVTAGNSGNYSVSGGTNNYSWGGTSGASGGGNTKSISFPTAGTYTVTVSDPGDANYNASNASINVTVTAAETWVWITYYNNYSGWSAWSPDPSTVPVGQTFTQSRSRTYDERRYESSNLGNTRNDQWVATHTETENQSATGTQPPAETWVWVTYYNNYSGWSAWSPDPATQPNGVSFNQSRSRTYDERRYESSSLGNTRNDQWVATHTEVENRTETGTLTYTVTITVNGSGSTNGSGTYNPATVANLTATAAGGFIFTGWSGPDVGLLSNNSSSPSVTVSKNIAVTANFIDASTAVDRGEIDFGTAYLASAYIGNRQSIRDLTIKNDGGAPITVQSVVIATGTSDFTLGANLAGNLNAGASVTAPVTFEPSGTDLALRYGTLYVVTNDTVPLIKYTLVGNPKTQVAQTITFNNPGTQWADDGNITLVASSTSGLPITFTVDSGPATVSGNTLTFTGLAGTVTITASQDGDYDYRPAAPVTRSFQVNKAPTFTSANNTSVQILDNLNFTATAVGTPATMTYSATGLPAWASINATTGVISGTPTLAAHLGSSNVTLRANNGRETTQVFTLTVLNRNFTLTLTPEPAAGGTVTGGGTYLWNTVRAILATPNAGYRFGSWTGGATNGNVNNANNSVTMTGNLSLTGNFIKTWLIRAIAVPAAGGWVSINGSANAKDISTTPDDTHNFNLSATPVAGYRFTGWSNASTSTNANITGTATADAVYEANFIKTWTLTVTAGTGGSVTGSGTFDHGTNAPITATPAIGYRFVNWGGAGVASAGDANTTVAMTQDRTVTANFVRIYTLNITTNGSGSGTTTGAGTYDAGTIATVTATADPFSTFAGWAGNGITNPGYATATVLVDTDKTIVANFINNTNLKYGGLVNFGNAYVEDDAPVNPRALRVTGTYTNEGNLALVLEGSAISYGQDDYNVNAGLLPHTVDIGNSAQISLRFNPDEEGNRQGRVVFHTNDPLQQGVYYDLVGNGVEFNVKPAITIDRVNNPGARDTNEYTYAGDTIAIRLRGIDPNDNLVSVEGYMVGPSGWRYPAAPGTFGLNPGTPQASITSVTNVTLSDGPGTYLFYARAVDVENLEDDNYTAPYAITVVDPTTSLRITAQNVPESTMKTWISESDRIDKNYTVNRPRGVQP